MSIFGKLWDRIKDAGKGAVSMDPSPKHAAPTAAPTAGGTVSPSTTSAPVDVEAIMTNLETASGHKSNWRYSIVDLMSLLGMDNSLSDRKELAQELGFTGDMNDSATMNIWLHKQVMKKMAENGGKVPANLLD